MGCVNRTPQQQNEFGIIIQQQKSNKSRKCRASDARGPFQKYINSSTSYDTEKGNFHLENSQRDIKVRKQNSKSQQKKANMFNCKIPEACVDCVLEHKQLTASALTTITKTLSDRRKNLKKLSDMESSRKMKRTARAVGCSIAISYINSCLRAIQNTGCSSIMKLYSLNNGLRNIHNYQRTPCGSDFCHYENFCCQRPSPQYNPGSHYHVTSAGNGNDTAQFNSTNGYTSASALNFLSYNNYNNIKNSINFYAASSVILVLCYLTTTTTAATTNSETSQLDKHPIFDETSSDKEILDLLLEKKRYDKRLLPPVNDEDFCCGLQSPDMAKSHNARRLHKRGTLTVNVNVLLLSLASPDESSLKYEVEFLLNQQWTDPRLQYGNKSHYDFLNALHHHDSIWTPDTYFIMHGDFKDPIIPMHFALRIYRNGTITYAMRRHLILSCQGSLHIFPFDDPKCSFSMESISYEEAQIKYVWKNDEDTLRKSPSLTTLNAYLIKNQTTACDQNSWRGNYSCLRVDLIFTRDRAFYFTTVFIPGIILVTSSFITFWLEWNAVPARSMIGNYSCLQVELTFTRDRAYYFTTVFIPGIILVTSSFITFWLEWNAVPARVMIGLNNEEKAEGFAATKFAVQAANFNNIETCRPDIKSKGVTTMLNFFTTSNGFRSTLPVVSNLTAMNVWDGVCMCFIYASLLEFVCVNYFGRKTPKRDAVYRPGENVVTQHLPAVLSRIGVILASPLGIIEREFHAAVSSERQAHVAQHPKQTDTIEKDGHQLYSVGSTMPFQAEGNDDYDTISNLHATDGQSSSNLKNRLKSTATNTPPLILRRESVHVDIHQQTDSGMGKAPLSSTDETANIKYIAPLKPPRNKTSRSSSPSKVTETIESLPATGHGYAETKDTFGDVFNFTDVYQGEKRRDGVSNEIVACTICGGLGSPCTHSAKNGCPTESCFVQVRKREPHHPIRVAKTIDVIARITFPTAYAIFLIFFFVHYKGFS